MNVNELPQYKCHKVVRAGKIKGFGSGSAEASVSLEGDFDNSCLLLPHDWVKKHQPEIGGYLVAYEDGYLSYSPASVFEAGYRELPPLGNSSGSTPAPEPKAAFIETWKKAEALAFDYAHSLPEGPERDQALQVYHRVRLVMSEGKSGMGGHGSAPATLTTDLPPHQLRVLQELAEVSTRHQKLSEFLKTKLFLSLDAAERDRLTRQHGVMGEYVRILIDRVAASQGES